MISALSLASLGATSECDQLYHVPPPSSIKINHSQTLLCPPSSSPSYSEVSEHFSVKEDRVCGKLDPSALSGCLDTDSFMESVKWQRRGLVTSQLRRE